MARIAIMQPYLFPYVGYFQLIKQVDQFVFFDNAQYIRRGYCNSNSILVNCDKFKFTLPVQKAPQKTPINHIQIHSETYTKWKDNFLTTIKHAYSQAPYYKTVIDLIEETFNQNSDLLSDISIKGIQSISKYLGTDTSFSKSSSIDYNQQQPAQFKIIEICQKNKADKYINMINGADLYDQEVFEKNGLELAFLNPTITEYNQPCDAFLGHLSIIDLLMRLSPDEINSHLEKSILQQKPTT